MILFTSIVNIIFMNSFYGNWFGNSYSVYYVCVIMFNFNIVDFFRIWVKFLYFYCIVLKIKKEFV